MWEDVFAGLDDVKARLGGKCADGVTRTFSPTVMPSGDITDPETWERAAEGGGALRERGTTTAGVPFARGKADAPAERCLKAVAKLFGRPVAGKPKRERKPADRGGVDGGVLNGTHAAE